MLQDSVNRGQLDVAKLKDVEGASAAMDRENAEANYRCPMSGKKLIKEIPGMLGYFIEEFIAFGSEGDSLKRLSPLPSPDNISPTRISSARR